MYFTHTLLRPQLSHPKVRTRDLTLKTFNVLHIIHTQYMLCHSLICMRGLVSLLGTVGEKFRLNMKQNPIFCVN